MGRKNLIWLGGLVLANLLVLAGIAQVWFGQEEAGKAARARKGLTLPKAKPLRNKEPFASFNVVVAKDLFSPDRSGAVSTADTGPGFEEGLLVGTIIVGEERAVLIGKPGKKGRQDIQVLRQGEQWRGFRLVEITKDAVVFQGKEGKRTLSFPRPKLGQ